MLEGLSKQAAQTAPLSGRVLGPAGKGVPGAQVKVWIVRREPAAQGGKEHTFGPWTTKSAADGRYSLPAVPAPKGAVGYIVRVEIAAEGYRFHRIEIPLALVPGVGGLRVPDVRLAVEAE